MKESKRLKKHKTLIGDGMIRKLFIIGLAKHEITSLIAVGVPSSIGSRMLGMVWR